MILIKRYPNRKLYNTETKQYITLEGIADLIRSGNEIQVIDHASGEDLTTLTMTQIILEQQKKQSGLLSNSFLAGLIQSSGGRLSALQQSLFSPGGFLRQFDEEIRQRVHALVRQGEMSDKEGANLLDKLIHQGRHSRQDKDEILEAYLRQREVPTQEDLQKLYAQLEELSEKIEQMRGSES